jgi:4-hydroxy-tetrahydrodipicolinate synthase
VAVATPFKEDFSLDLDALRDNVRFMIRGGIRTGQGALLVAAAGGEHPLLNAEERMAVMDASVEAADGEVPVLASIQHTDVRVIVELARHAAKAGILGAQLSPTYYYPPSEGDVLRLFQHVASESDVTLMIYHTWWRGLNMSWDLLEQLAEIPSVRAVKWGAHNEPTFREGVHRLSKSLVVVDNHGDPIWSHILGGTAFVTHVGAFWPEYLVRIWHLLEARNYVGVKDALAEFKWGWSEWRGKVEAVTGGEGPFIKAAMEAVGLKAGPPRPPCIRPTDELLAELRELMERAGVPKVGVGAEAAG